MQLLPIRQRAEINRRAHRLIAEHGEDAEHVARALSRGGRLTGLKRDQLWSKVASRVAALTGRDRFSVSA